MIQGEQFATTLREEKGKNYGDSLAACDIAFALSYSGSTCCFQ